MSNKTDNIFDNNSDFEEDKNEKNLKADRETFKNLIRKVAIAYGAKNDDSLSKDIDEIIEFEETLENLKVSDDLQRVFEWIELFSPSLFSSKSVKNVTKRNLESFSSRTFANFFGWRVVQATLSVTNREIDNILLEFERNVSGKQDKAQRWKKCVEIVQNKLPIATELLYASNYFSESDKISAEKLIDEMFDAFEKRVESLKWIDEILKNQILIRIKSLRKSENFKDQNIDNFYENFGASNNFVQMVLGLDIFKADSNFDEKLKINNFLSKTSNNVKNNQMCKLSSKFKFYLELI